MRSRVRVGISASGTAWMLCDASTRRYISMYAVRHTLSRICRAHSAPRRERTVGTAAAALAVNNSSTAGERHRREDASTRVRYRLTIGLRTVRWYGTEC
jgi:hypothetical protein